MTFNSKPRRALIFSGESKQFMDYLREVLAPKLDREGYSINTRRGDLFKADDIEINNVDIVIIESGQPFTQKIERAYQNLPIQCPHCKRLIDSRLLNLSEIDVEIVNIAKTPITDNAIDEVEEDIENQEENEIQESQPEKKRSRGRPPKRAEDD